MIRRDQARHEQSARDAIPPRHVVLIHGFAGLPMTHWPLARMLRRAGFEARALGYDSWGLPLEGVCDRLGPQLARLAGNGAGPLHIIGHSLGGLVARALVARARPDNLGHVLMLGTPNAGSEIADFVMQWPVLKPILGRAAPALVTRRPTHVDALIGDIDYSLGIIAGNRPMAANALSRLIAGPNDGKVSVASTRLAGAADHIVLPLSHVMLLFHAAAHRQSRHFLLNGRFDQ